MGHLTIETLASLVGEIPSPEEQEHLDACATCRKELEGLTAQTEAMGSLPDLRPPAGDWEALEGRLASEGLIRSSGLAGKASRVWGSPWLQAAAALVLFLGGAVVGPRFTASRGLEDLADQGPPPGMQLIPVSTEAQPVSNIAEAAEAVRLAERYYMDALLQYRQLMDAQGEPTYIGDPAARFAAVEAILAAGRAALKQAPADPYVNGVLAGAMVEREALLRTASLSPGDGVF
jgi:hypothetical protein